MSKILTKAIILFCIILLGNILSMFNIFSKEQDFSVISKLVLYVTLPCAIITNLNNIQFNFSLLFLSIFGFLCNWIYIYISKKVSKNKEEQSFMTLNINGYNIGNFALPFVSFFLTGLPILFVSLFDAGSSLMAVGGNYAVANKIKYNESNESHRSLNNTTTKKASLFLTFLSSPAILSYIVMISLSILSISLPDYVLEFTRIVGGANTFLSMFMIGIALNIKLKFENIQKIGKMLFLRYGIATLLSLLIFFVVPLNIELKQTLVIILFAPIAGTAPLFTKSLGGDLELSAQVNSLSIIISVIIMSFLLTLWQ